MRVRFRARGRNGIWCRWCWRAQANGDIDVIREQTLSRMRPYEA
jgi:hypothetical protein